MAKGLIAIKFITNFACKTTGEVWECSLDMAKNLVSDKKAVYHVEAEEVQEETIKPTKKNKKK